MRPIRLVSLALALAAVTALVAGSVGFSTVAADRAVTAAVVEDDRAYVDVDACYNYAGAGDAAGDARNGTPVNVVLTNRFLAEVRIAEITSPDADTKGGTAPRRGNGHVAPGDDNADYPARQVFDGGVERVTVRLIAPDGSLGVRLTRTVDGNCPGGPE